MLRKVCLGMAVSLFVCSFGPRAQAQDPPKDAKDMTIKEIMNEAHKDAQLLRKVAQGEASGAEQQRLLALYESMAAQDPPMGDKADWDERTELLVSATKATIAGEKDGPKQLRKASNCLACHKEHKPKSDS